MFEDKEIKNAIENKDIVLLWCVTYLKGIDISNMFPMSKRLEFPKKLADKAVEDIKNSFDFKD